MNIGKVKLGGVPRIVAVLVNEDDIKRTASAKKDGADLLELRIDCFKKRDTEDIRKIAKSAGAAGLPVIATIRSSKEGGKIRIEESVRLKLFEEVIPFVDALDIEFSSKSILRRVIQKAHSRKKTVIVSYHNFKMTPGQKNLETIIRQCKRVGADIVKIATMVQGAHDMVKLASLLPGHKDIVAIAMGKLGAATRIFFPLLGSLFTYCPITAPSAPGQMSLKVTKKLLGELEMSTNPLIR